MTRQEFIEKLTEVRLTAGIKRKDICLMMNIMERSRYRMESATYNSPMDKVLQYLNVVNFRIYLIDEKGGDPFFISKYKDIGEWVKTSRKSNYTQQTLAEQMPCSCTVINNTESGKGTMGLDLFLRLAEVLGFSIDFVPANLQNNE
ncbi:MAG: helix-turn-helix domain-containing protein [Mediterranea sp.]|jgi:transcriptional regulator with XRE-family HTH domain|nr:helix-turn-helix domain-containing protein [Mediterranea sp.]